MSDPSTPGTGQPEPLTPEALAILKKARRSFGISVGILLLGFMAIGVALVYRVLRDAPTPEMVAEISLPVGAEVVSAVVSEGVVNITYGLGAQTTLTMFDAESGEKLRDIAIGTN